jgi:hypothetical protein
VYHTHSFTSVRENTCSGLRRINTQAFSLISVSCTFLYSQTLLCSNESFFFTGLVSKPQGQLQSLNYTQISQVAGLVSPKHKDAVTITNRRTTCGYWNGWDLEVQGCALLYGRLRIEVLWVLTRCAWYLDIHLPDYKVFSFQDCSVKLHRHETSNSQILRHRYIHFPKIYEPPQNSKRQKGDKTMFTVRRHRIKFSRHGDLALGICAPLF